MDLFTGMRTFVEVVKTGSMNAAARRLNVTSALVGQRIAALEDHLQVRLLNRTTRKHSLTEFGRSYLEQCQDILELVALSEGKASDQQIEPQGLLRIAAPVSFGSAALVPLLARFCDAAPQIEIDLVLSDSNEDLIEGSFDVAFRIGPLADSSLMQTNLGPYQMRLCASPEYLRRRETPQLPQDLAHHRIVRFTRAGDRPWQFSKDGQTQIVKPHGTLRVNAGQALRTAVTAGMGVGLLPEVLVRHDIAEGKLISLLPEWSLRERSVFLLYHRDRYRPQRVAQFIQFAKAYLTSKTAL